LLFASSMVLVGIIGYSIFLGDLASARMRTQSDFLSYFENSLPEQRYFEKTNIVNSWRPECAYFDVAAYRAGTLAGDTPDSKPRRSLAETCYLRDPRYKKSMLLWGDSHAQALAPGLTKWLPKEWQFLQVATSGCAPEPHSKIPSTTSQCDQSNYFAMKVVKDSKPDVVVIAQAHGHSVSQFAEIALELRTLGVTRIIFVGPVPQWDKDLPKLLARSPDASAQRMKEHRRDDVFGANNALVKNFKTDSLVKFANVIDVFCNPDGCMTYLNENRETGITTWDYGHLTPIASEYLANKLLIGMITI
jgi:hypothetical protein